MTSEQARVGRALDLLTLGLFPFVQQEMAAVYGSTWTESARASFRNDRSAAATVKSSPATWDAHALLTVIWDQWNVVFRHKLGQFERTLVSELREFRNRWAHQALISEDDAYRVVDSAVRLLTTIGAANSYIAELERIKIDVLRQKLSHLIDDDLLRMRASRQRSIEILLHVICGAAVLVTTLLALVPRNPLTGLLLMSVTLLTFGYLVYQRLRMPVVVHGVHECPSCRKIIYTEVCPYCVSPIPGGVHPPSVRLLSSSGRAEQKAQPPV